MGPDRFRSPACNGSPQCQQATPLGRSEGQLAQGCASGPHFQQAVLEPDVREMLLRGVLLVSLGLCGPAFGQPHTTTEGPTTYDAIFKPLLHPEAR